MNLEKRIETVYKSIALANSFYKRDSTFCEEKTAFLEKESNKVSLTIRPLDFNNDRTVPIEDTVKSEYEIAKNAKLAKTYIQYGPNSDEYLKGTGLLAVAIANKILIQSKEYKPDSEEGKALLEHELTHVQQYTEQRIAGTDEPELEEEAENNEKNSRYNPSPLITKKIGNKEYAYTKKQWKEISQDCLREVESWIENQEKFLSEEEYYKLLLRYEKWENREKIKWIW